MRRWTITDSSVADGPALEDHELHVEVTDLLPEHLVTQGEVLKLCGWRNRGSLVHHRGRDFPEPVKTLPRGDELWDVRDVRAWLRARR